MRHWPLTRPRSASPPLGHPLPQGERGRESGHRPIHHTRSLLNVGDTPLPRPNGSSGAMYAQFQDEYGFIGDHKIDMRTRQSVRQFATISNDIDMSQFALPLGNLLVTGGVGDSQGIAIYAHQAEADTRPPSVAWVSCFNITRCSDT